MNSETRKDVIWIGSKAPDYLRSELGVRGGLRLIESNEDKAASTVASTRAAIVEFNNDVPLFIARARRIKDQVVPHGCFVGLVRNSSASAIDFDRAATVALRAADVFYGPQDRAEKPLDSFHIDWRRLAQRIYDWQPGPSYNPTLTLPPNDLPKDRALLLKRAFWDFDQLVLKKLSGGKSGAVVYQVTPRAPKDRSAEPLLPYLAKFDDPERIAAEHDRYERLVRWSVPFNHRPNVIPQRTVYGPSSAILVEDFMTRALPISALVGRSNASILVSSIFDGALQHWRRFTSRQTGRLSVHTLFAKMLNPKTEAMACLSDACSLANAIWKPTLAAPDLIDKLKNDSPIGCEWSTVHGDLHMGNLFIGAGSSDVVLIDYYRCAHGPSVIDPACFEVDVLFRRTPRLDARFVKQLYRNVAGAVHSRACPHGYEWVSDCVRATRHFGASTDSKAYTYALAVFLLSFASYTDNRTPRRRALAAHISSRLANLL